MQERRQKVNRATGDEAGAALQESRPTGYTDIVQFILTQATVRPTTYGHVGIVIAPADDPLRIAGFIGAQDIDDVSRPGMIVQDQ
jgi:hypothetical protein